MYEDSELKEDGMFHSVGYSPSSHGHEVADWTPLAVSNAQSQQAAEGSLAQFSAARPGHLATTPRAVRYHLTAAQCASECLKFRTCRYFAHEQKLHICEIFEVTEGANAERKIDRDFVSYERLGLKYTALLRQQNLPLRHGTVYFMNADVENVLGYRAVLSSAGTMVDFTPPHPGPLGDVVSDVLVAGGCEVSILQRCVDANSSSVNHR